MLQEDNEGRAEKMAHLGGGSLNKHELCNLRVEQLICGVTCTQLLFRRRRGRVGKGLALEKES